MSSLDHDGALYDVFATDGVLQATDERAGAVFNFGSNRIYTHNTSFDLSGTDSQDYDGDVSCESLNLGPGTSSDRAACLDKNDLFLLLNPTTLSQNSPFINLYKARSIQRMHDSWMNSIDEDYGDFLNVSYNAHRGNRTSRYYKHLITTDINTNWAHQSADSSVFHVYKFTPVESQAYQYIAECSNRGLCNSFEGTCECFSGYTNDNCDEQETVVS
mmetsp:Transcript_54248/g.110714  ORF Transcript_54248/g.110714 Transcript_54248/m.110714 type:complete len:216 (+) Transcript_54248:1-648(+)